MAKHQNSHQPLLLLPLVVAVTFAAVAVLPAPAHASRSLKSTGFIVQGRVFCDTCLAGFETPATTYIAGAKVRVECRERSTGVLKYSADGVTNESGAYKIAVINEHENEVCESVLVSSPDSSCASILPGRDHARIVLSHNVGAASDIRLANALGFQKDSTLPGCAEVMKQYQLYDDLD